MPSSMFGHSFATPEELDDFDDDDGCDCCELCAKLELLDAVSAVADTVEELIVGYRRLAALVFETTFH